MTSPTRYPTDCNDEEWSFAAPYLTMMKEAAAHGIRLEVVKLEEAKRGFVLLPRRWVVERSFAWASRFRRLAKDHERLGETLLACHVFAYALLMLAKVAPVVQST